MDVVRVDDPSPRGRRPLALGAVAVLLVAASVGGTLWITRDKDDKHDGDSGLKPTSMADWQKELATTGLEPLSPEALWSNLETDICEMDGFSIYVTLSRSENYSLNQERIGNSPPVPTAWTTAASPS